MSLCQDTKHDRELSRLEKALSRTSPIETYVRYLLTTVWMMYWGIPVLVVFMSALAIASYFGPVGSDDDPELFTSLTTGLVTGIVFLVAAVKAVVGFSRRWSGLAFATSCYLIYDCLSALPVAMQLYPRFPNAALHLGIATLLRLLLHVCYLVCFWQIWRSDEEDRRLCASSQEVRFFPRRALRPLTVVPTSIGLVWRYRLWTTSLIVLGAGFLFVVPYNLDRSQFEALKSLYKNVRACSNQPDGRACIVEKTTTDFRIFVYGLPIALAFCVLTGRSLLNAGGRRITWSIEDLTRTDLGSLVLFLRSFRQDRVSVASGKPWLLGRIIMFGQPQRTLDEIVLDETSAFGPVMALSDPANPSPQFGAARGQLGTADWHAVVIDAMSRASLIVLFLDETEGVRWEVEQIALRGYAEKCLFLVPGSHASPVDNLRISKMVLNQINPALALSTSSPLVGLFFDRGEPFTGHSRRFTSASYLLMIRWFLRSKHGATAPERGYVTTGGK